MFIYYGLVHGLCRAEFSQCVSHVDKRKPHELHQYSLYFTLSSKTYRTILSSFFLMFRLRYLWIYIGRYHTGLRLVHQSSLKRSEVRLRRNHPKAQRFWTREIFVWSFGDKKGTSKKDSSNFAVSLMLFLVGGGSALAVDDDDDDDDDDQGYVSPELWLLSKALTIPIPL